MALELSTRGRLSQNADVVSSFGRLVRSEYIFREIIYITYTSDAYNTEIALSSTVTTNQLITSTITTTQELTSSITTDQIFSSSINQTIAIEASLISQYYAS